MTLTRISARLRDAWNHRHFKKMRASTKAGLSGLVALVATSGLAERFHQIDDWESLIVLIVTWLAARIAKQKPEQPAPTEDASS